jgi:hypothetical protein
VTSANRTCCVGNSARAPCLFQGRGAQRLDDLARVFPQQVGDFHEFADVEPPFAAFNLRDEGLGLTQLLCQFDLRYALPFTRKEQSLDDETVDIGIGRFHANQASGGEGDLSI